jgi:hypothetical protein
MLTTLLKCIYGYSFSRQSVLVLISRLRSSAACHLVSSYWGFRIFENIVAIFPSCGKAM